MTTAPASKMLPPTDVLQFLPKKSDKQGPMEPFKLPEEQPTDETTARDPVSLSGPKGDPMTTETFLSLLDATSSTNAASSKDETTDDQAADDLTARDPLSLAPAVGEPMTSETFLSLTIAPYSDSKGSSTTNTQTTTSTTST